MLQLAEYNEAQQLVISSGSHDNYDYVKKGKIVVDMIEKSKGEHYFKFFKDCKNKPNKMLPIMNNFCRNTFKETTAPVKLQKDSDYTRKNKSVNVIKIPSQILEMYIIQDQAR